ncbi:WD repeat-containing protein-like protein mip1 [Eremomyces bilateralis CBS 781.70]|uniref:WD repeat-containing protein-like protein mip1 n=1 Tax=Eremomyces bilateralis CBS 781.70 TaxID=1392243 RepID=A0A6G1FWL8_9PEZI|nr:WD repeat-containing protein-like protein mip1 [Eremomyces bilateralis CBS 781.70]KAF1810164.1 WD repeat-containing protein-like protein mip1 [Eremomyces bilateralis CBS 781.70]
MLVDGTDARAPGIAARRVNGTGARGASSPRPGLLRAKTDFGPRGSVPARDDEVESKASTEVEWGIRHGFDTQLNSEEYNNVLNSNFFMYFTDKRHETGGNPREETFRLAEWRMRDRLKTISAVILLCLNIGVDPPDAFKTNPCAKLECWIDPTGSTGTSGQTAMNTIGKQLQWQYEQLSMRTRFKLCLDPTVDETKKFSQQIRRNARQERILLHYNGHGVPKPTPSGEIWVFNRNYTQYIPISLFDLQAWLGAPSIFVYDCSEAGLIINNFNKFAEKHIQEIAENRERDPHVEYMDFSDCIQLAACREKETLPTNPELPADIFTSCLTTPIDMAVRFFVLHNPLPQGLSVEDAARIPGKVSERRTPIGELNWIFTAITDTIAWNSLETPVFKKLFRQDLMVAALFRNFLLAQRIMQTYHCHPQCYPEIPDTHNDPLWHSWDLALENIMAQMPDLMAAQREEKEYEYHPSDFFAEQLSAFEVYLNQGAVDKKCPEQLPIVLQVLLSQSHRLRALILLSKFLDLGPWAVNLALSIGIFPYVLKLLQSQAPELKPVMVFIWARILAVDQNCQSDLVKDNGYRYFTQILRPDMAFPTNNASEHRAMCAFIVAIFCKDFHQGQVVSLSQELIEICLNHMSDLENPLLRQWACLCLSMLWVDYSDAKWAGIRCGAHQRLCELVVDPVAEVRSAMLHALTTFLGITDLTQQVAQIEESIASMVLVMAADGNSMVRKELIVFFSTFVARYQSRFLVAAYEQMLSEQASFANGTIGKRKGKQNGEEPPQSSSVADNTVFAAVWKEVLILSVDPHPEVSQNACVIVDYILAALLESPLEPFVSDAIQSILGRSRSKDPQAKFFGEVSKAPASAPGTLTPSTPTKQDSYITLGLKRTASIAASLRNLAVGGYSSGNEQTPLPKTPSKPFNSERTTPRGKLPNEWRALDGLQHQPSPSAQGRSPMSPPPKRFSVRRNEAPQIPLKSNFFDWCVEYFREPQMKPSEADEPGSTDYNERLWRRTRNDRIIEKTQILKEEASSNRWDRPKGFWNNATQPIKMCFHQFEDQLIVADAKSGISVWDWKKSVVLSRFNNGNPLGSKITELRLINEDDHALLMTGSSDGSLKVFRNYETSSSTELVTAFRALTDLVPSNKNAGLVFDWQQSRGQVLVAGDVKVIRVWNAGTEICTADIPARSGSCITSLTSDQVEGHMFVAAFGDGAVRVYDQRLRPATAMVRVWKEHKQWISGVHLQRGGQRELVSACRDGEVKLWDMRWDRSIKTVRAAGMANMGLSTAGATGAGGTVAAYRPEGIKCLTVHEHAPVFAVGTTRHQVNLFNTQTLTPLSSFEPYSSFLGHRATPVATIAFHPHRMMIAGAAEGDHHINVYACGGKKPAKGVVADDI